MADIYNLGTAGATLNATTTTLVHVVGPAVWFPGTAGNELTCTGFTIPSTLGVLPLPFTDGALTITADDIAGLPTDAPQFTASTGQTVSVNRGTSNAVTTLVPDSTAVYINPDATVPANEATIPTNIAFDVAATDDMTMIWCGQLGHNPPATGRLFRTGTNNTETSQIQEGTDGTLSASFSDDAAATFTATLGVAPFSYRIAAIIATLTRSTGNLVANLYTTDGLTATATTDASTATSATSVNPSQILRQIPGTVASFAWNTGPGTAPTDDEQAAIAAYLLEAYPPDPTTTYLVDPNDELVYLTYNDLYLTEQ